MGDDMKQTGLNREMLTYMYGDNVNLFEKTKPDKGSGEPRKMKRILVWPNITFDIDGLNSMVKRIERRFIIASGGADGLVLLRKEAREAIERKEKREWEKADLASKHKHEADIAEKALQAKLNNANTLTRTEEHDLLWESYKYAKKVSGKLYFSMQEFVNASEEEGGAPLKIKQLYWKLYGTPTGFTGAKTGEGFTKWKRDREKSLADLKKVPI